jgi:hypothetical protein
LVTLGLFIAVMSTALPPATEPVLTLPTISLAAKFTVDCCAFRLI